MVPNYSKPSFNKINRGFKISCNNNVVDLIKTNGLNGNSYHHKLVYWQVSTVRLS